MGKPTAKWEVTAKGLAKKAVNDRRLLAELLQGTLSKEDETRYTSFKALMFVCEVHPELLYPEWDRFVQLLDSENAYQRYIAIYLIASLTRADTDDRFEKLLDKYYSLLDDKSVIPAAHLASNSGKIAKAKPKLRPKITGKLLSIDKTHHSSSRKELIKSYIIDAFDNYFEEAEDKKRIIEFVTKQLKSKSPKTRKKAREFLARWLRQGCSLQQRACHDGPC
ncbi:hypothetical protein [[Eubacterium] cellulosolvens]